MKALVTLEAHNLIAGSAYQMPTFKPRLNGIACPTCSAEMVDSAPYITLTSLPPKKHIQCTSCDYRGTAYA